MLGPPEEVEDRRFGDFDVEVRRWPLPLWPHLYWEVLSGPGGSVLNEHLVRAPGSPVPPATATDLRVWQHVLDDVIGAARRRRAWTPGVATPLGGAPARRRAGRVRLGPAAAGQLGGGVDSTELRTAAAPRSTASRG